MSNNTQVEGHLEGRNDEISLKDLLEKFREIWKYLLSKWINIFLIGMLGGALGLFYAYVNKPVYTATTTFVLESGESGGMGQYAGLASMVGLDLGGDGGGLFQGDNILELYKSRIMLEKTLLTTVEVDGVKESLMERYITIHKLRESWKQKDGLANLRFDSTALNQKDRSTNKITRLRDSVLGETVINIRKNILKVDKPDQKLNIIQVDVVSQDEQFSKLFNDKIVETVNEFYYQTKTKKSAENIAILQSKVDSVRAAMSGAIYTVATVSDATPNLNPTRQVQRLAPQQKAQFSAETNKSILSSLIQNLEMAKISMRKEAPLIQKIDSPIYPLKEDKFGRLKGIILGSFFFGFLAVVFFIFKKVLKEITSVN